LTERHQEIHTKNGDILRKYVDGIAKLKESELHEAFKTPKRKTLMDVYHDET
jgi:hypothetical protein